jgi:hypothetical protein
MNDITTMTKGWAYRRCADAVTALSVYDQIKLLRVLANELSSFDCVDKIDSAADEIDRELLADNARVASGIRGTVS